MSCTRLYVLFLLISGFLTPSHTCGWVPPTSVIDSLLKEVQKTDVSDSFKVEIYKELIKNVRSDLPKALEFVEAGLKIASLKSSPEEYYEFMRKKGVILFRMNQHSKALPLLKEVWAQSQQLPNPLTFGKTSNTLGVCHGTMNMYDSSIYYFEHAAVVYESLENPQMLVRLYSNLGATYNKKDDYLSALDYYRKAHLLSRQNEDAKVEAELLNNIGLVYIELGNYVEAEEYFIDSRDIASSLDRLDMKCLAMMNLGASHFYLKNYAAARKVLQEGISIGILEEHENHLSRGYYFLGKVFEEEKNYENALEAFLKSKQSQRKVGLSESDVYTAIARCYFEVGNLNEALKNAEIGLSMALNKQHSDFAAEASALLSKIQERRGEVAEALQHARNHTLFQMEVSKKTAGKELLRLRAEFDTEQKEHELERQSWELRDQRNRIAKAASEKRVYQIVLGSLAVLFVFSMAFGYRIQDTYKKLKRLNLAIQQQHEQLNDQARELKMKNKDLEQFSMALGHDLKQPLTTVKGYAMLLEKTLPKYTPIEMLNVNGYLKSMMKGITRMDNRIENLLAYYRTGSHMKKEDDVDLNQVLHEVKHDLHQAIAESEATIMAEELPQIKGDPDLIAQLFQNLISNSIKYAKPGIPPYIRIQPYKNGKAWSIDIEDNGIGIDKKSLREVFDLFSRVRGTSEVEGEGIGLATCKRIMELHGGDIHVSSTLGEGTTFSLKIPFSKN